MTEYSGAAVEALQRLEAAYAFKAAWMFGWGWVMGLLLGYYWGWNKKAARLRRSGRQPR